MRTRKRRGAGSYKRLVTFQRRVAQDDGYGNVHGDWQDVFTSPARVQPKLGGEGTTSARMQGTQPYLLTIRSSTQGREVTPTWRAYDARAGMIDGFTPRVLFDIKSVSNPDERDREIEMMVVDTGVG